MFEKPTLTVTLYGRMGGKSTLIGQLLHQLGVVSDEELQEIGKTAEKLGKASCKYSFLVNRIKKERELASSTQLSYQQVEIKNYFCNFIDTPGNCIYMGRAFTGLAISNVVIAMIDPRPNELENSLNRYDGILRFYSIVAKVCNPQMICCVSMDHQGVDYSEQIFHETVMAVSEFINRIGFKEVNFIPISGFNGDNIVDLSDKTPWYTGKCLLDALNSLKPAMDNSDQFLRISILEVKCMRKIGTVVYGKIVAGTLKWDSNIVIASANIHNVKIKSIESFGKRLEEAKAGQLVAINLENVNHELIKKGDVILGEGKSPGMVTRYFEAKITNFHHPNFIRTNYTPTIQFQTTQARCKIIKIKQTSTMKGDLVEKPTDRVARNRLGLVECELAQPCYLDLDLFCRFYIRDLRKLIGVGIITRIGEEQPYSDNKTTL